MPFGFIWKTDLGDDQSAALEVSGERPLSRRPISAFFEHGFNHITVTRFP